MSQDNPRMVLTHLRRPHIQGEQEDTWRLLEAGLELVTETLGRVSSDEDALVSFRWPTRARIVARFNKITDLRMSKAVFEERWSTMPKYYADLFAWALHQGQWAAHKQVASMAASALAKAGTAFDEVAHHIALTDMKVLLAAPTFRIKLLICAMKQRDPSFKSVLSSYYGAANAWWDLCTRKS
jgi:hypothetical protein